MKIMFVSTDDRGISWIRLGLGLIWPDYHGVVVSPEPRLAAAATNEEPDLVIIHEETPGAPLWGAVQSVRQASDVPIIVASASREETDVVKAFDLGADEYIALPCGILEMTVRVAALVRRLGAHPGNSVKEPIRLGDLTVDPSSHQVFLGPDVVKLTATEFKILHILVTNSSSAVSKEDIGRRLDYKSINSSACLKKHIQRIRFKLGDDPKNPRWIRTVRGFGYRIGANGRVGHSDTAPVDSDEVPEPSPSAR